MSDAKKNNKKTVKKANSTGSSVKKTKTVKDRPSDEPQVFRNENGQIHRLDGPAMIDTDGTKRYFVNGELHREDGPAVEFPYAPEDNRYIWRAVGLNLADADFMNDDTPTHLKNLNIGKMIIETPSLLTVEIVNRIKNVEIKRIAIDRMGVEKWLKECKATILDEAVNDIENTTEGLIKAEDFKYFVGVCKSTGRVYHVSVPDNVNNIQEARSFMNSGKPLNKCVGAS